MARRALLLLVAVVAALAVVHRSAADDGEDVFPVGGMRRWLQVQDLNATDSAANATDPAANATAGYISFGALTADTVPCSVLGASYYNCRPGAEANPYERSCTAITQCRG